MVCDFTGSSTEPLFIYSLINLPLLKKYMVAELCHGLSVHEIFVLFFIQLIQDLSVLETTLVSINKSTLYSVLASGIERVEAEEAGNLNVQQDAHGNLCMLPSLKTVSMNELGRPICACSL